MHRVDPDAFLARGAFARDRRHVFGAVRLPSANRTTALWLWIYAWLISVLGDVLPPDAHGRLAVTRPHRLTHERNLRFLRAASGGGHRGAPRARAPHRHCLLRVRAPHQPRVVVHPAADEVVRRLAARQAIVSLPSEVLDRGEQKSEHRMAAVCFVQRGTKCERTRGDFVTFVILIGAWRASVITSHI